MAGVLGSIAMVTGVTVLTMGKTFQSVVQTGATVVTSTAESITKVVTFGNDAIQRAATRADVNSRLKDREAKLRMSSRKQRALVEYGENADKFAERFQKLNESTQEVLRSLEKEFPEELL